MKATSLLYDSRKIISPVCDSISLSRRDTEYSLNSVCVYASVGEYGCDLLSKDLLGIGETFIKKAFSPSHFVRKLKMYSCRGKNQNTLPNECI